MKKREQADIEITTRYIKGQLETDIDHNDGALTSDVIDCLREHARLLFFNADLMEEKEVREHV